MKSQFRRFVLRIYLIGNLILLSTNNVPAQQAGIVAENFEEIKAKAENGESGAQLELGLCYYYGRGVTKDLGQAAKWYHEAAVQGLPVAQVKLGSLYSIGQGVHKDEGEAVKWYRKAAEQGDAVGQDYLADAYSKGEGVPKDCDTAIKWYRKAADQDYMAAITILAMIYRYDSTGNCWSMGVQDYSEAAKWYRKGAELGDVDSQIDLGDVYLAGEGVAKDGVEAYKWYLLAWSHKDAALLFIVNDEEKKFKNKMDALEQELTPSQRTEGQRRASDFRPRTKAADPNYSDSLIADESPKFSGTGFFITDNGYLISNYHVVKDAAKVRLLTGAGLIDATVVKVDAANDLALLKVGGQFATLPIASSRSVKLGGTIATVGFPDIGLQGFAPKLAKGEIASLSGASDDPRYFQISVPVQPGNSGGALVDARGNVVGIVAAKLDASAALAASGALPENVNYAVKSSLLLSFLESVPDVSAKLKEPNTKDEPFEDVVKSAQDAAVLVLVY